MRLFRQLYRRVPALLVGCLASLTRAGHYFQATYTDRVWQADLQEQAHRMAPRWSTGVPPEAVARDWRECLRRYALP